MRFSAVPERCWMAKSLVKLYEGAKTMKFKGNNPVSETIHPDPDQKPTKYPEPIKFPDQYQTIEEANIVENDEGDPRDAEGGVPADPPENNVLVFHRPQKRRVPKHNI